MTAKDIGRYLPAFEEPKRGTLQAMRRRILKVIVDAEQCICYAVPAFEVEGKAVAGLAAFKKHLSYLPHSDRSSPHWPRRPWLCPVPRIVALPVDTPLPRPLIKKLLTTRMRHAAIHT